MSLVNSKKGVLMAGVAITFIFLMSYAAIVFMVDKPDREEENLELGKMVLDIYDLETDGKVFEFYLKKSMEYSAIKAIKKRLSEGLSGPENCLSEGNYLLYSSSDCLIDKNSLVESSVDYMDEFIENYFEKQVLEVSPGNFEIDGRFDQNKIIFEIETKEAIEFSSNPEKMSYRLSPEFLLEFKYSFSEFDVLETFLKI